MVAAQRKTWYLQRAVLFVSWSASPPKLRQGDWLMMVMLEGEHFKTATSENPTQLIHSFFMLGGRNGVRMILHVLSSPRRYCRIVYFCPPLTSLSSLLTRLLSALQEQEITAEQERHARQAAAMAAFRAAERDESAAQFGKEHADAAVEKMKTRLEKLKAVQVSDLILPHRRHLKIILTESIKWTRIHNRFVVMYGSDTPRCTSLHHAHASEQADAQPR